MNSFRCLLSTVEVPGIPLCVWITPTCLARMPTLLRKPPDLLSPASDLVLLLFAHITLYIFKELFLLLSQLWLNWTVCAKPLVQWPAYKEALIVSYYYLRASLLKSCSVPSRPHFSPLTWPTLSLMRVHVASASSSVSRWGVPTNMVGYGRG